MMLHLPEIAENKQKSVKEPDAVALTDGNKKELRRLAWCLQLYSSLPLPYSTFHAADNYHHVLGGPL